ncbi:hypothetical protein BGZ80_005453 [Entomortierella chlamydospora]|uniref:Uncharacterized protein n=1 Tax=Entomortierella chlamydospora TaxID=101097 RepID=A0A9P6MZR3_9FUNG|nr:hypothetical protein BGZ79_006089 [Entomortierella chlamydospora]KAG0019656.1 hypothetical protein BGZ80_005453 [Entomortierella chlamydospora]
MSPVPYEFGTESLSRKRSLAATTSDVQGMRSVSKHNQKTLSAEARRRNKEPRSRSNLEPIKGESSSLRMNKRLRQLAEDENAETSDNSDIQEPTEVPERLAVKDIPPKNETEPTRHFSRPKPPGKNRVTLIQQSSLPTKSRKSPSQGQESQSTEKNTSSLPAAAAAAGGQLEPETGVVPASLESRMNHVRDWLKERKPPMLSPPLSARSDDMRESRMPYKRKAYRQLAPTTGPKRLAIDERQDRQIGDDDSKIYPQLSDTVASAPQTQTQTQTRTRPLSSQSNALLSPRYNQLRNSRSVPKRPDPSRDQPESDSSLPPIDWSKFQRPDKAVVRTSSSLSATAAPATVPSSSFTFRKTPTKSSSFISRALNAEDDDNPAVSPLIKLRQSQLKQRQQEDYLGIKRDESFVAEARRADAEGAFAFNQALEIWEREDDETLARNAAREAAEAEARSQRLGHSRVSSSPSLDSDPEEKTRRKSTSYLERDYTMAAPASSLLRTVPFNGESSRRPVPDFQPKKSPNDTKTQNRATGDLGTSTTPSKTTIKLSSLLDQRPLSSKTLSASFNGSSDVRSIANTRGSASLTKRNSYPNSRKEEDTIGRRQRHPGLYTPSKKKPTSEGIFARNQELQPQSPRTPTAMSRYIQLSNLSDEEPYD